MLNLGLKYRQGHLADRLPGSPLHGCRLLLNHFLAFFFQHPSLFASPQDHLCICFSNKQFWIGFDLLNAFAMRF